jgi:RNA polymerase sigma-70 factor (ECF subfamily)
MDQESQHRRLGEISTLWGLIAEAAGSSPAAVGAAQKALLERYGGAVRRYLVGALRDPEVADDLFQEFALRFVRGDFFVNASPERGRFRNFVKTSLFNLVVDYQRRQRRRRRSTEPIRDEPAVAPPGQTDSEQNFLTSWREQLLERTWLVLAEQERQSGAPYHTVLRFRAEQPLLSSAEMADHLSVRLGKAYTVDGIRQTLHRARERFADLLVEEVVQSLESASAERLEEELSDLGLLEVCRAALQRRQRAPRKGARKGVMPDEDDV